MNHKLVNSWVLLSLLMSTLVYSYPQPQAQSSHIAAQYLPKTVQPQAEQQQQQQQYQYLRFQQPQPRIQHYQVHSAPQYQQQPQQQNQQPAEIREAQPRKFAQKANAVKKVDLTDVENDIETNQIENTGPFSWTNMLGTFMQMVVQNSPANLPTKSEDTDSVAVGQTSPWANIISIGLRIFTTLLGGGAGNDGIDKVDNGGGSPMQSIMAAVLSGVLGAKDPDQVNSMAKQANEFIAIVFNLLDALKTSFSHRSLAARSIGKKDSVSDLGIASIAMLKGYVKTTANSSERCMQKYVCEANTECNNDIGGNSIFCQMGSYATSFVLERQTGSPFEKFYDAGRRGRQGEDCKEIYLECAESF